MLLQKLFATALLILLLPLIGFLYVIVRLTSPGSFIFRQQRAGKNKKIFTIYKIRTMVEGAEKLKKQYLALNSADGPVFKILDDPRYTKVGKIFAKIGLDEMLQLINIIKGDMVFIGPRPLPVDEAAKISRKYHKRFSVYPGMTSLWIIKGAHKVSFKEWMEFDIYYVKNKGILLDLEILFITIGLLFKFLAREMFYAVKKNSQRNFNHYRHPADK